MENEETIRFVVLPSSTYLFTVRVEGFYFHLITLIHTPQSVGLLWRRDGPVAEDFYLTTQTLCKRKTSMPPVGFEPTIPASAPPQTYTLDSAATGIGRHFTNAFFTPVKPFATAPGPLKGCESP
jgi:hypothetical protein